MRAASAAFLLACLPALGSGADLLVQAGQAIPPGNWVQISGTTGYQPDYPGFDKFNWVPALKRACVWSPYRTLSTEPDHTLSCYSFAENNWIVLYNGHQFHDEHSCAGHNEGGWSVDPTTSMMYGPSCYSAGQAFDDVKTPVWRWDMLAQTGTAMLTTPGPIESINQMNSYFDPRNHKLVWFGGGGSNSFTFEYNPDTNVYSIAQATSGAAPAANLRQPAVFYRTADGKGYYLFGKSGMTVSNSVNSYDAGTHTWALVTPSGTAPSARMDTACAYSTADDAALCTGGYDDEDPPGPHNLGDTWVLDFAGRVTGCGSPPCWAQLSPATPLASFPGLAVFERMVYDPDNDTFLVGNVNVTTAARFIWAYRFNPGPNAGYAAVTPSVTYLSSAGSLNRNISGGVPSLSQSISLAVNGSTIYYARAEGGGPATSGASPAYYRHIYVSQNSAGTITDLPNPSLYSSIAADIAGSSVEANEPTVAVVGGLPWVAWSQWNGSGAVNNDIVAKSFNGTVWVGGNIGRGTECTSTSAFCLQHAAKIIDANGTPTIAYVQATHTSVPYQDLVFVKQFNGTSWSLLGGILNVGYAAANTKTVADHPSIAGDGTANPWVAWTESTLTTSSPPDQENYTNAKMYLSHWTGTAWVTQCGGTGNVSSAAGWASNASVTVMGGVAYVAYTERGAVNGGTANDINKLYVRKCQAGAWTTVGSAYLNRDQAMGWVFRPEISNDGTNVWVSWDEQGNDAPWAQTYSLLPTGFGRMAQRVRAFVNKWDGTAWTKIGGTLNADSTNGVVSRTSMAMKAGAPVVAWGETKFGSLRQIYAKQWTGTDWGAMTTVSLNVATSSLPATTVGAAYSQTVTASGGTPPYAWTLASGALPGGLTLASATGLISGTPATAATSNFTVQVTDSLAATATKALSILANAVPAVTTASPMPGGTTGAAYSQTLANSGGTAPFTWSISAGSLPAGLAIVPATGAIGGTAQTGAVANFTARILDNAGVAATKAFTITISSNLAVTTATPMAAGTVGAAYSQTLAGSGGFGADTWAVTAGALPAGLSLAPSTGIISGTPTGAATSNFTAQATDAGANAASKALGITINANAPVITTISPMAAGAANMAYSQTLTESGGTAPFTWSITAGSLPAGLTLTASTGTISGIPTAAAASTFTVQLLDSLSLSDSRSLSITTIPPGAVTLRGAAALQNRAAQH